MPKRISYWLLLATIILLPWYVVRFTIAGIPLTLLECSALLTIAVWLAEVVLFGYGDEAINTSLQRLKKFVKNNWVLVVLIGLFMLSSSVSVAVSDDLRSALGIYKAYILEPIAIFFIAISLIDSRRAWWEVITAFGVAALSVIGLTYTQWIWQWPNFAPAELVQGRSSAMFNTANAVGLFIGPITVLAAACAIIGAKQGRSGLSLIAGLLFLLGGGSIFLSQSTGALIALSACLMGGAAWWVIRRWKSRFWRFMPALIGAGLLVYVVGTLSYMFWFNQPPSVGNPYARPGFSTFTVRQCTWEGTVAALNESPVTGLGLAGFTGQYLEYSTCDAEPLVYPHNFILNFWSELGMLGLVAILLIAGYWMKIANDLLSSQMYDWLGVGLVLAVAYWLIHGLVDVPYFKNDLAMAWWLLFSLTVSARYLFLEKKNIVAD